MDVLLTIGGSDSAGCSGIQADLRVFAALGAHGASVVTAITAQNTTRVDSVESATPAILTAQLRAVLGDLRVRAVKIGMLAGADAVYAVAAGLAEARARGIPIVLDPVLAASTGAPLSDAGARDALLRALVPLATVVTPNAPEAAALTGTSVHTLDDALSAGRRLLALGARAALIKGGHLAPPGSDVLVTRDGEQVFAGAPIEPTPAHTRGTGCTLSAALATYLALGMSLADATARARLFVRRALAAGYAVGSGPGPIDAHFARPRAAPAPLGRLHVITDTVLQSRLSHGELARQALAGGADVIQLRDKRPGMARELTAVAREVAAACCERGAACIVNDRADVALAAGAHGVHVGRDDVPPHAARLMLGPHALVGATVHNLDEMRALARAPIDYVGAGPVFGTGSKDTRLPALGLDGLRALVAAAPAPVIALGNITPERVSDVLATGAFGIAVLSGICLADEPAAATRRYRDALLGAP